MSCQPERAYFLGQVLAGFVERSFLLLVQCVYLAAHLVAVDALVKPRPALAKVMLGNVGHRQDVVAVAQLLADGGNVAVDATEVAHYHLFACTLRPLIAVGLHPRHDFVFAPLAPFVVLAEQGFKLFQQIFVLFHFLFFLGSPLVGESFGFYFFLCS